jgi:hypothetical protein
VRALVEDRQSALRGLTWQKQAAQRAMRERRTAERFSARLANRRETPETARAQSASGAAARPS